MIDQKIKDLIIKELNGELGMGDPLPTTDKQTLDKWVNESEEHQLWYSQLRDPQNLFARFENHQKGRALAEESLPQFIAGINEIDQRRKPGKVLRIRQPYVKIVAACAIVVGCLSGAYHFWRDGRAPGQIILADAAPGTNRAILKKAGGVHIDLAAAPTGQLAGGLGNVQKLDSTQIVYSNTPVLKQSGKLEEVEYDTIVTPRGGQYRLTLPDGSRVVLNAASSLRFPTTFTGKDREVALTGEAYFDVTHRPDAPFKVRIQNMTVTVLGTQFAISDYPEDGFIKTTLIDGAVKIQTPTANRVLTPAQQATVHPDGTGSILVHTLDDPETAIAFASGMMEFDRDSITTVMNQIARWYSLDVVYAGMPQKTFTASLSRSKNAAAVLKILQASGGAQFKIEGSQVFVKP